MKTFLREREHQRKLKNISRMGVQIQEPIVFQKPEESQTFQESTEPTDLFSMLRLNSFNSSSATATTACDHLLRHASCNTCGCCGSNSMKRRSPTSCSSLQDPSSTAIESDPEPRAKKHFCEQEDVILHGFSSISLPMSLGTLAASKNADPCPVLRRCVSDPYNPPATTVGGFPATSFHSPEHTNAVVNPATPSSMRGSASTSGLPPLPPSLKRCVSDLTPSPAKTFSRSSSSGDMGVEETPNSMRLRRMKNRLREMRQWWEDVMREDEEEDDHEGPVDDKASSEDDKVRSKDDCGGEIEEAVSVEWAEKCLSIHFKCPCGKGYRILLSGNNCYYKLV